MNGTLLTTLLGALASAAAALLLAPLFEGLLRKLKAFLHSRQGPPILQPYLDVAKLLGKEDLRTASGVGYAALPALALSSVLVLALYVPWGPDPALGFGGDVIAVLYVAAASAVMLMLTAFASGSPYASVGGSREMMMLLSVEPVLAVALITAAVKAGSLHVASIRDWQLENGPSISLAIAGIAFFLALQAQAGKLPFDVPEADQEIMGGPLIEQSGPRLALLRWAIWSKQLVLAVLLVELFLPWPRIELPLLAVPVVLVKAFLVLLAVGLIDVVNPRLRIDQAMGYFLRVAVSSLAGLAFAVIGM